MPQTFIFWETNAPDKELIVCNEKEVWNYLPDEELAYRYSPKVLETSHAILNVITGQAKLEDNFEMKYVINLGYFRRQNKKYRRIYPLSHRSKSANGGSDPYH